MNEHFDGFAEDDHFNRMRGFRRMARNLANLIPIADPLEFERRSGRALCELCGHELADHPEVDGGLTIDCSGRLSHL